MPLLRAVALPLVVALVGALCPNAPPPAAPAPAAPPTVAVADSVEPARAASAMVATGHPEASRAGLRVLRQGGNAVDAAVAIGFTMAVVSPDAGNLGGGGFMVIRRADGSATSWDFRETAPRRAWREMYAEGHSSQRGHRAVGVPGTVAGLLAAHAAEGRLPLADVIEPAIRLAEGQYLSGRNAILFNRYRSDFAAFASTAQYFTKPDGAAYSPGERFVQADLAAALRRNRDDGRDGFYRGRTADLIVAEMARGDGLISHDDLAGYRAVERPVLESSYRGHRVLAMGPPASGGIALAQALRAVEPVDLAGLGFQSPEAVHLAGEALRRAFADRAHWLGDPDFVDVPAEALIEPRYVASRMATFDPRRASRSAEVTHGTPPPVPQEGTETTHMSVVDAEGNAVALTVTLNDYFGSKVVVGGAGFFLNDEMDDFTSAPGRPNGWGLVQGERNAVAPGRRMVSSMTPVILEDPEGRLFLVAGSPGGARIISTVFEVVTNVVDFGLDAQQAVSRPRFHHQWLPDELEYESGLPDATLGGLRQRGWRLDRLTRFGAANIVVARYGPDGARTLEGGADPRRDDDDARGY